jgi:hypothetical protein
MIEGFGGIAEAALILALIWASGKSLQTITGELNDGGGVCVCASAAFELHKRTTDKQELRAKEHIAPPNVNCGV